MGDRERRVRDRVAEGEGDNTGTDSVRDRVPPKVDVTGSVLLKNARTGRETFDAV